MMIQIEAAPEAVEAVEAAGHSYVVVGSDGLRFGPRPVVWGLGSTPAAAMADARRWLAWPSRPLVTVAISAAAAALIESGVLYLGPLGVKLTRSQIRELKEES